jgi:hypothetical protein
MGQEYTKRPGAGYRRIGTESRHTHAQIPPGAEGLLAKPNPRRARELDTSSDGTVGSASETPEALKKALEAAKNDDRAAARQEAIGTHPIGAKRIAQFL